MAHQSQCLLVPVALCVLRRQQVITGTIRFFPRLPRQVVAADQAAHLAPAIQAVLLVARAEAPVKPLAQREALAALVIRLRHLHLKVTMVETHQPLRQILGLVVVARVRLAETLLELLALLLVQAEQEPHPQSLALP
jgi:hypothetical protein